jgi:hypothetical protein
MSSQKSIALVLQVAAHLALTSVLSTLTTACAAPALSRHKPNQCVQFSASLCRPLASLLLLIWVFVVAAALPVRGHL